MAINTSGTDELITNINVTPLVDIILVLLIIFMVTTEVIHDAERPNVIEVKLPAAASADQLLSMGLLNLVIDRKGQLYLNGEKGSKNAVAEAIEKVKSGGNTAQALISADENTAHGIVVSLMDFLRLQGVTEIAINTQKQTIE
jgi:biopolymer transport protein ExbD